MKTPLELKHKQFGNINLIKNIMELRIDRTNLRKIVKLLSNMRLVDIRDLAKKNEEDDMVNAVSEFLRAVDEWETEQVLRREKDIEDIKLMKDHYKGIKDDNIKDHKETING